MSREIEVRRAEEADFIHLAELIMVGFQTPITQIMFPKRSDDAALVSSQRLLKDSKEDPTCSFSVAVLDGEIVGLAQWNYHHEPMPITEEKKPESWPKYANVELCRQFFGSLHRARAEHMGGKRCAVLVILVVSPAHRGLGVGTRLLEDGLRIADQDDLPAWLEASVQGRPLYKKKGFEEVGVLITELSKYGGVGEERSTLMLRPNKSGKVE